MIVSPEGIGKKPFRGFVELFLDISFRNAKNDTQLCACAAQDFLLKLNKVYGDGIFRAIIENHDSRYLQDLDMYKAAFAPKGLGPFGQPFGMPFKQQ